MDRGNVRSMRRPSLDAMTESMKTMPERMLAGELYIADDPVLGEESARAQSLAHRYNTMDPTDAAGRRAVMEELLGAFGEDVGDTGVRQGIDDGRGADASHGGAPS